MTHKKDQHHSSYKLTEHLNGKHFLYAGLATTTLIGGMGATPLVLADKTTTTQTELVTKKKSKKAKAQKESRDFMSGGDAHEFSADDFEVEDGVIMGFTESFGEYQFADDANWDGAVTFPAEFATTITGINEGAFSDERIRTVDLNSLTALETIGRRAFAQNIFLEKVDISNLSHLKTIDENAFEGCEQLETVNLSNLPALTNLGNEAFIYCDGLKTVNFDGLTSLQTLSSELFEYCTSLTTVTFNNLSSLEEIEWGVLEYTPSLQVITLTNMPNLKRIAEGVYHSGGDWGGGALSQVIVGNLGPDLVVEMNAFGEGANPGGLIIPVNGDTDREAAHKILLGINGANSDEGPLFGVEKWSLGGAITYKYVDQDEHIIKVGTDNIPVKAVTVAGKAGTKYNLPTIPTIAGYGNPTLLSGVETGIFDYGLSEIVYQYQANTAAITIYRVDTNDKNLVPPETVTGFVSDTLDLNDKQLVINGYDFKELNVSALSRAVGAYTWQPAPDSIGKSLTLGVNAGRNYKFVYVATPAPTLTPDKTDDTVNNSNNTNNSNNAASSSSANSNSEKAPTAPADTSSNSSDKVDGATNTPSESTSTTQNPNGLPSTGVNDTNTSGIGNNRTSISRSSNTRYVPLNNGNNNPTNLRNNGSRRTLPQSGVVINRVLPVLGAIALAGVISLYAFSKKKSNRN